MDQQSDNGVAGMPLSKPDLAELLSQNLSNNRISFCDLSLTPFSTTQQSLMAYCMGPNISLSLVQQDPFNLMEVSKYMSDPLKCTNSSCSQTDTSTFDRFVAEDCLNANSVFSTSSNHDSITSTATDSVASHYVSTKHECTYTSGIQSHNGESNYARHGVSSSSSPSVASNLNQPMNASFAGSIEHNASLLTQQRSFKPDEFKSSSPIGQTYALDIDAFLKHSSSKLDLFNDFSDSQTTAIFNKTPTPKVFCDICGRGFATMSYLQQHRRIHSGERPYECQHCGKKFTQMSHVKQHERVHTGERPYTCQCCDKRFTQLSNLRSHQRGHHQTLFNSQFSKKSSCNDKCEGLSDDYKLKQSTCQKTSSGEANALLHFCNRCGQAFTSNVDLLHHHEMTHRTNKGRPKGKNMFCRICSKPYTSEAMLRRHLLERHQYDTPSKNYLKNDENSGSMQCVSTPGVTTLSIPTSHTNFNVIDRFQPLLNGQDEPLKVESYTSSSSSAVSSAAAVRSSALAQMEYLKNSMNAGSMARRIKSEALSNCDNGTTLNNVPNDSILFSRSAPSPFASGSMRNSDALDLLGPSRQDQPVSASSIVQSLTNSIQQHP